MLNERIRQLRISRGMSQVELARKLCVTKQSISNWENDNIQPSIDMLMKLSVVFSTSTDYLLGLDDRKCIEVTGLTDQQIGHVQAIINDIVNK